MLIVYSKKIAKPGRLTLGQAGRFMLKFRDSVQTRITLRKSRRFDAPLPRQPSAVPS